MGFVVVLILVVILILILVVILILIVIAVLIIVLHREVPFFGLDLVICAITAVNYNDSITSAEQNIQREKENFFN